MSVLFLDIDGVLNDHAYDERAESTTLLRPCVDRLNRVLDETGCVARVQAEGLGDVLGGVVDVHDPDLFDRQAMEALHARGST
jgi:hypothetical protein